MMQEFLQLDHRLLHLVNAEWTNGLFDAVMPWVRLKYHWLPLYAVMIGNLLLSFKSKSWFPFVLCIVAVAVSDQLASSVIKPLLHRMRPCQNPALHVRMIIECGSGFSFVSSHAANHFTVAVLYSAFFKRYAKYFLPALLFWAALVSYAQVYVGYHFPSDVFVGALLGTVVALALALAFRKKIERLQPMLYET